MKSGISLASLFFFAANFARPGSAQTYMTGISKYGDTSAAGNTILPYYSIKNFPVMDFDSDDLRCRTSETDISQTGTEVFKVAKAGDTVTLYWEPDSKTIVTAKDEPEYINGPCTVYLSPYENDAKDGWFKIYGSGMVNGKWCTEGIRSRGGKLDVTIDASIAPGKYYLRGETIGLNYSTLNSWDDYTQGAQSFANCAVIEIVEGGDVVPDGESIPGIYDMKDKALMGDFSDADDSYEVPGPAEYKAGKEVATEPK
ncbi:hypothetical protein LPJ56_003505 [Coemansia sp. RSA 2599]|nr:hypothetical protein LPJ75_003260 [Coemansia sp. RSA 2598]KAJ1820137.1 hypothetical protein LPJ56_003505 [Coemansia sp. RSA 2599]